MKRIPYKKGLKLYVGDIIHEKNLNARWLILDIKGFDIKSIFSLKRIDIEDVGLFDCPISVINAHDSLEIERGIKKRIDKLLNLCK